MKLFLLFFFASAINSSQNQKFEDDVQKAYINAKKGIYYALEHIPESKNSLSTELIDSDKLIAKIKVTKEVRGVKVESEGFNKTYEVRIVVYRSYKKLMEEGFIKYIPEDT